MIYVYDGGFWVRITRRDWGISIIDRGMHAAPFSVRNGFVTEWRIGPFGIQILKPLRRSSC